MTRVEVVLLSWQQLPEELLSLSANWMYLESRFYRIAQVDMEGVLTIEMLEFLEHLKEQNHIADFCSRVIASATISAFASALGTANASARILFSMGRDGFINNRIGTTSRRTASPAIAVAIVMIITFAVVLIWSRAPGINGAALFGFLGTIGVFLILVAYILTNVGAIRFFVSRRLWTWQTIIPLLAILVLGYTLYSNIYPVPAPPYNIFPYVALAWMVIGLITVLVSPALVRRIGLHLEESEGLHVEEHAGPVP